MKYSFTVRINGTSENSWHRLNLKKNPFPKLGKWAEMEQRVYSLDDEPIKGEDDIRRRLKGLSEEFVELCCREFKPGERVVFDVSFEGDA